MRLCVLARQGCDTLPFGASLLVRRHVEDKWPRGKRRDVDDNRMETRDEAECKEQTRQTLAAALADLGSHMLWLVTAQSLAQSSGHLPVR